MRMLGCACVLVSYVFVCLCAFVIECKCVSNELGTWGKHTSSSTKKPLILHP